MSLKFGDAYSIAKRDEARVKAKFGGMFSTSTIDKLIDVFEEVLADRMNGFAFVKEDRVTLRDEVLEWLAKHYEP